MQNIMNEKYPSFERQFRTFIFHVNMRLPRYHTDSSNLNEFQKPLGEVVKTPLQNENGISYYMRLFS